MFAKILRNKGKKLSQSTQERGWNAERGEG